MIKLIVNGAGQISWTEHHGFGRKRFTRVYPGEEAYITIKPAYILKPNDEDYELEPGEKSFSFSFSLPNDLPSSVQLENGSIDYSIESIIKITGSDPISVIQPFEIVSDLNMNPILRKPFAVSNDKQVGVLCCKDGMINAYFGIQKSGFVPGENIDFSLKIENKTVDEALAKIDIFQKVVYQSKKKKTEIEVLKSIIIPKKINPKETYEWKSGDLKIPNETKPTIKFSKIIQISHFLVCEYGAIATLSVPVKLEIPIEIGQIGIKEDEPYQELKRIVREVRELNSNAANQVENKTTTRPMLIKSNNALNFDATAEDVEQLE